MTTVSFDPEKYRELPPRQAELLTPELVKHAAMVVDQVFSFVESEGQQEPQPVVQRNGYDTDEAYRDELIRQLSLRFQTDLEATLNQAEQSWRADRGLTVDLEPWMQTMLDVEEAKTDEVITVAGVQRWARLAQYRGQDYWLREVEIGEVYDPGFTEQQASHSRILHFQATPTAKAA